MKQLTILLAVLLCCSCSKTVSHLELTNIDGLVCLVETSKPFTGKVISDFHNGIETIQSESNYKDGKRHGKHVNYYSNGQKQLDCNYKDGEYDGKFISYHEDGKIASDYNFKDGKKDGQQKEYYENGILNKETNYEDGELKKYIVYAKNGQIIDDINY